MRLVFSTAGIVERIYYPRTSWRRGKKGSRRKGGKKKEVIFRNCTGGGRGVVKKRTD